MDLRLLKTFLAVVDAGSFSAAAQDLHCVQSNVTTRIRRLETHLGRRVFERGRGGASLTVFGQRLRTHAVDLVARFEAAERDLLDAAGGSAPLRLGSMESTAAVRLPSLLKSLQQLCPAAQISLRTGPTGDLLSWLWDRKLDAAFVAGPIDQNRFRSVVAFRETLVIACAAGREPGGSLLAFRTSCSYRATAETWLRSEGRLDTPIVEMGTLEGILGCVEAGMGFAVAPVSAVRNYGGAGALSIVPLPEPFAVVDTHLTWRKDLEPPRAHGVLCRLIADLESEDLESEDRDSEGGTGSGSVSD